MRRGIERLKLIRRCVPAGGGLIVTGGGATARGAGLVRYPVSAAGLGRRWPGAQLSAVVEEVDPCGLPGVSSSGGSSFVTYLMKVKTKATAVA